MVSVTTANPPETFSMETHGAVNTQAPHQSCYYQKTAQDNSWVCLRGAVSVKLRCKQTKSLSCMLGLFVATPAGFFTLEEKPEGGCEMKRDSLFLLRGLNNTDIKLTEAQYQCNHCLFCF